MVVYHIQPIQKGGDEKKIDEEGDEEGDYDALINEFPEIYRKGASEFFSYQSDIDEANVHRYGNT